MIKGFQWNIHPNYSNRWLQGVDESTTSLRILPGVGEFSRRFGDLDLVCGDILEDIVD
jgi:hypothetical protein